MQNQIPKFTVDKGQSVFKQCRLDSAEFATLNDTARVNKPESVYRNKVSAVTEPQN